MRGVCGGEGQPGWGEGPWTSLALAPESAVALASHSRGEPVLLSWKWAVSDCAQTKR